MIPPYPVPLKGILIRIRVVDPDSRQIREVTVTEDPRIIKRVSKRVCGKAGRSQGV